MESFEAEENVNSRLVHAAVVENKTGISECQASLLGLQIKLHDLVVTCRKKITVEIICFVYGSNNLGNNK